MFTSLHLPDFPLQAWLCRQPGLRWEAAGVLSGEAESAVANDRRQQPRLIALTRTAIEAGVEPGMTAAQARARCAALHILPRDREAEAEAQARLLETAARASADFEETAPGLVTIDLGASPLASRPDDLRRIGHEWVAAFADRELKAQIGFAPNPDLAALAARIASPVRLFRGAPDALREQLAPLPLEILDPPADYRAILTLWGIGTLGDLTALPRDEIAECLGPDAADLWDRAAGKRRRLLRLVRPPADFTHSVDLDHEITTLEPLMFLIRRSLETLTARLASVYLATSAMRLTLRFTDGGDSAHLVRVPDPGRDAEKLFRLIHTRLEDATVRRPIEGYQLELTPARPGEQPFHLFESSLRDPNRFAETLAQLEALIGSENVGSPVPADTHRPDAFSMRPFDPGAGPPPMRQGQIGDPTLFGPAAAARSPLPAVQGLPLRRFRPPLPVQLTTRHDPGSGLACPAEILSGQIHGRLHHLAGPWRLSGDWWETGRLWRREEWDAQLEDGSLYRLACWREARLTEEETVTWYVEGVYG
jgi:protein ImuB